MGKYYYKSMTEQEFKGKFNKFFHIEDVKLSSEQELADYIAHEQCIRDPYDQVQYKFIFIENYGTNQSVIIFKCH